MPKKPKQPIKNMGASVRARLLNLSKQRHESFSWCSPIMSLSGYSIV